MKDDAANTAGGFEWYRQRLIGGKGDAELHGKRPNIADNVTAIIQSGPFPSSLFSSVAPSIGRQSLGGPLSKRV